VVGVDNALALGTGPQIYFNHGTLANLGTDELEFAQGLSIGGLTGKEAVLDGGDFVFTGQNELFTTTGKESHLVVNNTTVLQGVWEPHSASFNPSGFTIGGTGKLVINADGSGQTASTTLADTVTFTLRSYGEEAPFSDAVWGAGAATTFTMGTGTTLEGRGLMNSVVIAEAATTIRVGEAGDTTAAGLGFGYTVTTTSTLFEFDIFSRTAGENSLGNSDYLDFTQLADAETATVELSGTLSLGNESGGLSTLWEEGDTWQLIDWGNLAVANRSVNLTGTELPELSPDLEWNFDLLLTQGVISIQAVPEPSRMVLLVLAGLGMVLRRQRRRAA
jgi:hypothetical protein